MENEKLPRKRPENLDLDHAEEISATSAESVLSPFPFPYSIASPPLTGSHTGNSCFDFESFKENLPVPPADLFSPRYSSKVFIGGIPINTSENDLRSAFGIFDHCDISWPNRRPRSDAPPNGYCFVQLRHSEAVVAMLNSCIVRDKRYFFRLLCNNQYVQVRPWNLDDAIHTNYEKWHRFIRLSVFVGGLPRTCTAKELSEKVEFKFGSVLHCSIELEFDTSYPKGAARVVFGDMRSYCKAACAGHIEENWFQDRHCSIEFKPFVYKEFFCEMCRLRNRPTRFCADSDCLSYLCNLCFNIRHNVPERAHHQPIMSQARDLPHPCRLDLQQAAGGERAIDNRVNINDVHIPNIMGEQFNLRADQYPISEAQYRQQTGFAMHLADQPHITTTRSGQVQSHMISHNLPSRQFGQVLNQAGQYLNRSHQHHHHK